MEVCGLIEKMRVKYSSGNNIEYQLPIGGELINMNSLIGQKIRLVFNGEIKCLNCEKSTKKSYSQGYCYVCMTKLARCDTCIMSPEKCHFDKGTCREPDWAEKFCMTDHIVYLANSSGLKVGITRADQMPTRWIDQGAIQALPILRVSNRKLSGLVEVAFKEFTADKTNWRKMLKNEVESINLVTERERLFELVDYSLNDLINKHGINYIQFLEHADALDFSYPVIEYPTKVISYNLDKSPIVEGKLMGIKGQYLILESGVINLRKYTSYNLQLAY
jgi:hypothetical protein